MTPRAALSQSTRHLLQWGLLSLALLAPLGCGGMIRDQIKAIEQSDIPRELSKTSLPPYRVEPPDILLIEAVNNIRPANDPLVAGDEIIVRASNALPIDPMGDAISNDFKIINSLYRIQTDGSIDLGPEYGSVVVEGLTVKHAKEAVEAHLKEAIGLAMPQVAVSLPNVSGKQPITGEHLVRPDGTISLGIYGSIHVAGRRLDEIKEVVEKHLSDYMHRPEIQVDVLAYNSKVIYVITDGGGNGEQVARIPYTGNESVLDAIAQIQGLSQISSKKIWVARPAPSGTECAQNMAVDWRAITQDAIPTTNYQLFPGDRIYIKADPFITMDNVIAKVTAPVERVMGFALFGRGAVRQLSQGNGSNNFGGGGAF